MFGYIRPEKPECKLREYEYYRGMYCGLCRALGKCTGQCSRMMLGYDFTFMALVRLAIEEITPSLRRSACIAHPFRKRLMAMPKKGSAEEEIFALCASATALLSYHKVRDDLADEKGARRLAARMALPFVGTFRRRARKRFAALEEPIREGLAGLFEIEKSDSASLDAPAEAFGGLLGEVLSYGLEDGKRRIAREIGFHVGKWIYLVDAADDYEEDIRRGRYNPIARVYGDALTPFDRESIAEALTAELVQAERGFDLLNYPDANSRGIVENIIYGGMPQAARRALALSANGKEGQDDRPV